MPCEASRLTREVIMKYVKLFPEIDPRNRYQPGFLIEIAYLPDHVEPTLLRHEEIGHHHVKWIGFVGLYPLIAVACLNHDEVLFFKDVTQDGTGDPIVINN